MRAYYNEIDPYAAQWLRNLIEAGHIAPGDVDERSIEDVTPKDLHGYTQCHFFAGIGVWSYALRKSGWTDDRPVWTGSCPCQPFSAAGKGGGFDDERHLWPAFHHLIRVCRPPIVIGEQVASKDGLSWLDLVSSDMEGEGYAFGAVDTCAAGVGAPHIRQRLYWVADSDSRQRDGFAVVRGDERDGADARWAQGGGGASACGDDGGLADSGHDECGGRNTVRDPDGEHDGTPSTGEGAGAERERPEYDPAVRSTGDGVVIPYEQGPQGSGQERKTHNIIREGAELRRTASKPSSPHDQRPGPTNGFWGASDWLFCKDGKWRPVEPSTQPLADGTSIIVGRMQPRMEALGYGAEDIARILGRRNSALAAAGRNRTGRLKGYGNAINKEITQTFIEAVMPHLTNGR